MKKQIILLFLVATTQLYGQDVVVGRKVIASGGDTKPMGNLFISFTIGEPVAGTVSGDNRIFTQGFQQPDTIKRIIPDANEDIPKEQISAKVFPNPAKDELVVEVDNATESDITLKLYNDIGQLLLYKKTKSVKGESIRLDVAQFSNALYILTISQNNKRNFTKQIVIQK